MNKPRLPGKKGWDWLLVVYLIVMVGIRFWNVREAAYFIFDVGRDLTVLRSMSQGDLKLIGQTTGLPGLFYGPLWYYVGIGGFLLTGGNPYGVQLWYIAVASLALPLYWYLSHSLLGKTIWAKVAAVLLAIIPGGITGTNFVWNVMLSVPLMAGALYGLFKARESRPYLYFAFLCLALTLQAEFAYAIFMVTTLWFFIPWFRGKWEGRTMVICLGVVAATLIPQGIFEASHHFSMTQAVLSGVSRTGTTVSQSYLWLHRPQQLWQATQAFFVRQDSARTLVSTGLWFFWSLGAITAIIRRDYRGKVVGLLAVIPYVFYMFWRGNYGYFFDYYVTPHFIFLTLLLVYGMRVFAQLTSRLKVAPIGAVVGGVMVLLLLRQSYGHLQGIILSPENNAGLRVMEQATATLFAWVQQDQVEQAVFRIYTPNMSTENYDYLVWWYARQHDLKDPLTVQSEADQWRYILYEPDEHNRAERFMPWYTTATAGYRQIRTLKIGVLTVEAWSREEGNG